MVSDDQARAQKADDIPQSVEAPPPVTTGCECLLRWSKPRVLNLKGVNPSAQPTIVIIDDDDAVRESTRMLLEAAGYAVRDHASAQSFLTSGFGEAFILIVDHHMPGMTGAELLERLHAEFAKLPALMMTGREDPTLEMRCSRIGVRLLRKPVVEDHLLEAIEEVRRACTSAHTPSRTSGV